jgi:hypothetical protein
VIVAIFNAPIATVTSISHGQAIVQLKTVWQRARPEVSATISSHSAAWVSLFSAKNW